jgi:disulfide bond formation protein DsbB
MSISIARRFQYFLSLLTLFVLGAGFYFQYVDQLTPCPLCLMQRFFVFLLGLLSILGWCFSAPRRVRWVVVFQMLFACAGLFFSVRQLWIQSFPPDQAPACLPSFDILIKYYPLRDALYHFFWGAGDCAEVSWQWFGLSMPAWAALYFLVMLLGGAIIFFLYSSLLSASDS